MLPPTGWPPSVAQAPHHRRSRIHAVCSLLCLLEGTPSHPVTRQRGGSRSRTPMPFLPHGTPARRISTGDRFISQRCGLNVCVNLAAKNDATSLLSAPHQGGCRQCLPVGRDGSGGAREAGGGHTVGAVWVRLSQSRSLLRAGASTATHARSTSICASSMECFVVKLQDPHGELAKVCSVARALCSTTCFSNVRSCALDGAIFPLDYYPTTHLVDL